MPTHRPDEIVERRFIAKEQQLEKCLKMFGQFGALLKDSAKSPEEWCRIHAPMQTTCTHAPTHARHPPLDMARTTTTTQ